MRETAIKYWSNITEILKSTSKRPAIYTFWILLFVGAYFFTRSLNTTDISEFTLTKLSKKPQHAKIEIPLNCSAYNPTKTCPSNNLNTYPQMSSNSRPSTDTCPEYFRWIHEDLRPWAKTGITREMIEEGAKTATFRLAVVKGRVYVEKFKGIFQTRDVFSQWGIIQLLQYYPGRLPDFEIMFSCEDWPEIKLESYAGPNATLLPPVFHYCADDYTVDIVFPDWSFWGWHEINIKPWVPLMKEISEGNKMTKWEDREPYAYWKGNPTISLARIELLKCNVSPRKDWKARLFRQDWRRESRSGFKDSNLANQCVYRYKIYVEGKAWSVSEKYILACDSPSLLVTPRFHDFFTRGLKPLKHYWPINKYDKCRSIKFAVDWGNSHMKEAQAIGKAASDFMRKEVKMEYVYDYMFHVLNEYSKLQRFEPTIPKNGVEYCSESMACPARGARKDSMVGSMVTSSSENEPCAMPPAFSPSSLYTNLQTRKETIEKVELWKKIYWQNETNRA